MEKHIKAESGQWIRMHQKILWQCCDCALVHNVWFKINGNGSLEVKMTRNGKETKLARKK